MGRNLLLKIIHFSRLHICAKTPAFMENNVTLSEDLKHCFVENKYYN